MSEFRDTNLEQYCDIDVFLSRNMIHCIETTLFDTYKINWCNQLNNDAYRKLLIKLLRQNLKLKVFYVKICQLDTGVHFPSLDVGLHR